MDGEKQQSVKVFYSSRRQADKFVKYVREKGSFGDTISFGQRADPCVGMFSKVQTCFRSAMGGQLDAAKAYDNLNVTVMSAIDKTSSASPQSSRRSTRDDSKDSKVTSSGHRTPLWILTDTSAIRKIDPKTLEPIGDATCQANLHPSLKGSFSSAHAQRCPVTGDIYNYNIEGGPSCTYRIFRVSANTGATEILATFSSRDIPVAYIHSFFLSERFVIVRLPSAHFGTTGLRVPWKGNLLEAMEPFDDSKKCRWFVIDRVHGRGVVGEFETPARFFFHTVNCWDEDAGDGLADVTCDVVDFPTTDILHNFYYDTLMDVDGKARRTFADELRNKRLMTSLVRWKFRISIPTASSAKKATKLTPELIFTISAPHTGELPTINPNYHTKPYRYVYSLPQSGKSTFLDTIVKTDLQTRDTLRWNNPAGHTPSEAIFVPRPDGKAEDDGVLLSVVLDGYAETSYLLCLDACTMEEVGRAEMDFAVGFGFHGMHSAA